MNKKISKIELQKRNKNRVNIYIDDEFEFACNAELVYKFGLEKDKIVDVEYIKNIVTEDNYLKCKSRALKIIEKSFKTEFEIKDKLEKLGYDNETIDRVIKFLEEYKFIDDKKYVQMYVNDRIKKEGKIKIKLSLIKKGIDEELINMKLESLDTDIERNVAYQLVQKKFNIIFKSEKNRNKIYKKLQSYLYSKGYDFSLINSVVEQIINDNIDKFIEHKNNENESLNENAENTKEELYDKALKRYRILKKSENNSKKLYKKLFDYLLRRGYRTEDIKNTLKKIIDLDGDEFNTW